MNNITARLVREELLNNHLLTDYLQRGIINTRQLARELLPRIRKKNSKASVESIAVAIQRLELPDARLTEEARKVLEGLQITMRTDVSIYCLKKGGGADIRRFGPDDIFFVNQGSNEVTVITDTKNAALIKGTPKLKKDGLALVALRDTLAGTATNYRRTPGFISLFLGAVAREGINVEDIITTYGQICIIVEEDVLSRVYELCKAVKSQRHI